MSAHSERAFPVEPFASTCLFPTINFLKLDLRNFFFTHFATLSCRFWTGSPRADSGQQKTVKRKVMKIFIPACLNSNARRSAFTLAEVMVGISIMSIMFLTSFRVHTRIWRRPRVTRKPARHPDTPATGRSHSASTRGNRSTPLLDGSLPLPSWTFYPLGGSGNQGITYTSTVSVANAPMTEATRPTITRNIRPDLEVGHIQRQTPDFNPRIKYGLHITSTTRKGNKARCAGMTLSNC